MGKDKKKKGKGAEKTAAKTEKKLALKTKKELAIRGEDDIETIVKAIEAEEKKRSEVKEIKCEEPPSHRSNFSLTAHTDNPELILFGGEFFNGKNTTVYNDLYVYNVKRNEWSQIKSPGAPAPRCSHQAVMSGQAGGQLWIFGGEFTNPSETQFHHYKDLWCFHFGSKRWEKIGASGAPSSRSGHRMILFKRHLLLFGGFHDNLRGGECKYFNDVHLFDLDHYVWKKIQISGKAPDPRSACNLFLSRDSKSVVVFGGFRKEKSAKKRKDQNEVGLSLTDMFVLIPDKHDETWSKWRWQTVKQVGLRPSMRTGMCSTMMTTSGKAFLFGGVQDNDEADEDDDDDDDDDRHAIFYNDLYSVTVENERATWQQIDLKKDRDVSNSKLETEVKELSIEASTKTVESGAFVITSTIVGEQETIEPDIKVKRVLNEPHPRYGSGMAIKNGLLYVYGGIYEDEEDRQITLKDFYSLDLHKLDEWKTIIQSDMTSMEWIESEEEDSSSSDDMDMD